MIPPEASRFRPAGIVGSWIGAFRRLALAQLHHHTHDLERRVTPGQIVHYVMPNSDPRAGQIRPAMVIIVWAQLDNAAHPGMVNLQIFLDGPNDYAPAPTIQTQWAGSVCYGGDDTPGTWRWMPEE